MYISEFVCGLLLGIIAAILLIFIAALWSNKNDKKNDKK